MNSSFPSPKEKNRQNIKAKKQTPQTVYPRLLYKEQKFMTPPSSNQKSLITSHHCPIPLPGPTLILNKRSSSSFTLQYHFNISYSLCHKRNVRYPHPPPLQQSTIPYSIAHTTTPTCRRPESTIVIS